MPGFKQINEISAREFIGDLIGNCRLGKGEGSGHFVMEEKPEQTADLIIDFLD